MAEHRDYRIDLHPSQTAELFDREHRLIFNVGGYNSGKTFTDAMIMLDRGRFDTAQRGGFFANSEAQLLEGLFPDIAEVLEAAGIEYTFGSQAPPKWRRRWERSGTPYPVAGLRARSTLILDTGLHVVLAGVGNGKFRRFKGWQFSWIIFEEITEQQDQEPLDFLIPRARCGKAKDGYCSTHHRHQIYVHGNPPPPDHPHWIRRYIADLEKKEELRKKEGLRPFFRRIQSSTFENIEYAGAEYVDTIRATLDEATAEAMLTGSLAQVRTSRAARAFSEANLIKVSYDPQKTIYLSLDFNVSPATALLCHELGEDEVPAINRRAGTNHLGVFGEFYSGATGMDVEELALALVRDERSKFLHVPDNFQGLMRHGHKVYGYGDATGNMKRMESPMNRSAWSIINSVMSENLGARYQTMVGSVNPSVMDSMQCVNGKFHASNGDRSLWISDAHCPELCIDLDETVWKPDGSELDKSNLMRGHLFDELRYVVQARYPINAKHRGGTFTKARTEDEFDRVLPAFGRG